MTTDTGIVTIYDIKNNMAPLSCHRIDARDFLAHPSGRWSASKDAKTSGIVGSEGMETEEDGGEAMRLKSMNFKALQGLAEKSGVEGRHRMKKADLVDALLERESVPAG